jgi:hypothetical protein
MKLTPQPLYVLLISCSSNAEFQLVEPAGLDDAVRSIHEDGGEGDTLELHVTTRDELNQLDHVELMSSVDGEVKVHRDEFVKVGLSPDEKPFNFKPDWTHFFHDCHRPEGSVAPCGKQIDFSVHTTVDWKGVTCPKCLQVHATTL